MSRVQYLKKNRPPKVNLYRANYVRLNEDLSKLNWSEKLADLGVDDAADEFYRILHLFSRDYPVYFSHEHISLIKKEATR